MFFHVGMAALFAFFITSISGLFVIPFLIRLKAGQTEREELKSHQVKTGTPTMGGIMILAGILAGTMFFVVRYPNTIPVICMTFAFGIIGFLDDYLKVVLKRSDGLLAWQKMILQLGASTGFLLYIFISPNVDLTMIVPFMNGKVINLGFLGVLLFYIVVIGIVNGVNFTDGVDGLASSVTIVVAVFLAITSILTKSGIEPIAAAVAGALLGFLLYNTYPAKVFMGDTGSLALGGFVAASVYMMKLPLFVPLIGLIYLVEVLSVMLQVSYFKITKGKRIFRMAPIHHHFELGGWSEVKVVTVFTIITALLALVSLMGLGY
ncbi:MAG: phospho-N-acetylmuramoyl-pentapeptide-transferase [Lachnospiraceae bacterium]